MTGRRSWIGTVAVGMALALGSPAVAGVKSLIAAMHVGDELRYTYELRCEETTSMVGRPGQTSLAVNTETVGVLVRVKADTTAQNIVEVVYESFKVTMDTPAGKIELDLAGPPPDGKALPQAHELYEKMRPLLGVVLTLNTLPGTGEITTMRGGEQLLKEPGAPVFRRYVDPDLFRSTFGDIFQLKPNSAMPPPGEPWYMGTMVLAYGRIGKNKVWETRTVDLVVGDIATIKGEIRASGNPEEAKPNVLFFKGITSDRVYKWDTLKDRLLSWSRSEVFNTRGERGNVILDSDLIAKSTLTFVPPEKGTKPAPKPVDAHEPKVAPPATPAPAPAPAPASTPAPAPAGTRVP